MSLYCTFVVDRFVFALPVKDVQEVMRHQEMTRVPLAPSDVRGLINLRGQIVTAIDLRSRLGLPANPVAGGSMNVLIGCSSGAISLLVDRIEDVVDVAQDTVERPPETLQGEMRTLIQGACKLKGRLLLLLDTARTLSLSS